MPRCIKCITVLSPDFFDEDTAGDNRTCHFCKSNTDTLTGSDGQVYRKQEVVKDYQDLLRKLKSSENIKQKANELYIQGEVKKAGL